MDFLRYFFFFFFAFSSIFFIFSSSFLLGVSHKNTENWVKIQIKFTRNSMKLKENVYSKIWQIWQKKINFIQIDTSRSPRQEENKCEKSMPLRKFEAATFSNDSGYVSLLHTNKMCPKKNIAKCSIKKTCRHSLFVLFLFYFFLQRSSMFT